MCGPSLSLGVQLVDGEASFEVAPAADGWSLRDDACDATVVGCYGEDVSTRVACPPNTIRFGSTPSTMVRNVTASE